MVSKIVTIGARFAAKKSGKIFFRLGKSEIPAPDAKGDGSHRMDDFLRCVIGNKHQLPSLAEILFLLSLRVCRNFMKAAQDVIFTVQISCGRKAPAPCVSFPGIQAQPVVQKDD